MIKSYVVKPLWSIIIFLTLVTGVSVVIHTRIPIGLTLWFVEKYQGYFVEDSQRKAWLDTQPLYERIFVEAIAGKLLRDWVTQQTKIARQSYRRSSANTGHLISKLANEVHHTILSQRYIDHTNANLILPVRLLIGFGYCDSINHLLAIQLAEIFGESSMWATKHPVTGISHHTLVSLTVQGVQIFADAWSSVPVFKLSDPSNTLSDVSNYGGIRARVPEEFEFLDRSTVDAIDTAGKLVNYLEKNFRGKPNLYESILDSSTGGLLEVGAYSTGEVMVVTKKQQLRFGMFEIGNSVQKGQHVSKYIDNPDTLYLIGRVFYLYGYYSTAREIFLAIARTGCEDTLRCRLARKFLEEGLG